METKNIYLVLGSGLTIIGIIDLWNITIRPELTSLWLFIALWTFIPGIILLVSALFMKTDILLEVNEPTSEQIHNTMIASRQQLDRPGW
ncbi:MAG: hypothetical protein ACTSW1_08665 [Candidatus Hodarchaeales archaeon]